jgi:hypothetical protein
MPHALARCFSKPILRHTQQLKLRDASQ